MDEDLVVLTNYHFVNQYWYLVNQVNTIYLLDELKFHEWCRLCIADVNFLLFLFFINYES